MFKLQTTFFANDSNFLCSLEMHPFSSLLSYYTALVESNLIEVKKWSLRLGINAHFSYGMLILFCHLSLNFNVLMMHSSCCTQQS